MGRIELNTLTGALRELCGTHRLVEKWILAPSRRIGFQWLDAVTRSGQTVLNARVTTVRYVALELASAEMQRQGLLLLRGTEAEVLVARLWARVRGQTTGYLSLLDPSSHLIQALCRTLRDLRMAGLTPAPLDAGAVEVPQKAAELADLLAEYAQELRQRRLVDGADVLALAIRRLRTDASSLPDPVLIVAPDDLEKSALERELWLAFPEHVRCTLPVDRPGTTPDRSPSDASLLGWISTPAAAPAPLRDGTASLFRAMGEANEIREVLRRCAEREIPLDDVEILHTDAETYVPAVFELAVRLMPDDAEGPPVTFAEGLPARYFRPGRALRAWVAWVREGLPQTILVRMLQDGLLLLPEESLSFGRLGAILRALGVGAGRDRYLPAIERELDALRTALRGEGDVDHAELAARHRARLRQRAGGLKQIRKLVRDLLDCVPEAGAPPAAILDGARRFLEGDGLACRGASGKSCARTPSRRRARTCTRWSTSSSTGWARRCRSGAAS